MTVADFYKVAGMYEEITIRKIIEGNSYSFIKLLYEGSVDELPSDMLEMYVLDIRVSRETLNMTITVE